MSRKFATIFFLSLMVFWAADPGREHKFQQAVDLMETKGDLPAAIKLFNEAAKSSDRGLVARSLLYLGQCREKLGEDGARKDYDRIVRDFADQRDVASEARARLASLTRGSVSTRGISVRQVWTGPDVATEGSVSPDGRYIPYADWGNGDLALRDLVTGEKRLLTHNPQGSNDGAEGAAWSPDGKRIAFAFENKDGYAVRIVGTDGSGLREIYRDEKASSLEPVGWSADGKSIVVAIWVRDKTTQFAWIAVSDGSVKIVKTLQQSGVLPYLSPDARYIAYGVGRKIFLIASDGSGETPLIDEPADSYLLGWLPDGKRVLFGSNRNSTNAAWAIAVADGKPQGSVELILRDIGTARVWPLGFTRGGAFYYSVPVTTSDIYTAAIDSSTGQISSAKLLPLARKGSNVLPTWSPDGRRLAYYRGSPGNGTREILVWSAVEGKAQTVRPSVDFSGGRLHWSVDGGSLMLFGSSAPDTNPSLYNVDIQTGAAAPAGQTISAGSSRQLVFTGSANGKVIAYWLPERRSLVVQRLGEGTEKVLYRGHNSRSVHAPALSPDGQQLAFGHMDQAQKSALMVLSTAGGAPRELLRAELQRNYGITWSPDGRHILFAKTPDFRVHDYEVWRIAESGGEPVNTGLKMTDLRDLNFHPDGRTVAFSAGKLNGREVWALENLLPVRVSSR